MDEADHGKTQGRPRDRLGDQRVEGKLRPSAAAICIALRYLDGSTTAQCPQGYCSHWFCSQTCSGSRRQSGYSCDILQAACPLKKQGRAGVRRVTPRGCAGPRVQEWAELIGCHAALSGGGGACWFSASGVPVAGGLNKQGDLLTCNLSWRLRGQWCLPRGPGPSSSF